MAESSSISRFISKSREWIPVTAVLLGSSLGTLVDFVLANKQGRTFLNEIARNYRHEIAGHLGKREADLTEADIQRAYRENPVLAQIKESSRVLSSTRLLDGAVGMTSGAIVGGVTLKSLVAFENTHRKDNPNYGNANLGSFVLSGFASVFAAAFTRKVAHKGFSKTTIDKTSHAKIMALKIKQQEGKIIAPADVFAVSLARSSQMQAALRTQLGGKHFEEVDSEAQDNALREYSPGIYTGMALLAERINNGGRPEGLLFDEVKPPPASQKMVLTDPTQHAPQVSGKVALAQGKYGDKMRVVGASRAASALDQHEMAH